MHGGRARLLMRERLEHLEGCLRKTCDPVRRAQDQPRERVSRHNLQDLARLLRGQKRGFGQQPLGVRERYLEGSNGLRSVAQYLPPSRITWEGATADETSRPPPRTWMLLQVPSAG